jgi:hypothetical protein
MTLLLITLSLFKRRSDRESASVVAATASA